MCGSGPERAPDSERKPLDERDLACYALATGLKKHSFVSDFG